MGIIRERTRPAPRSLPTRAGQATITNETDEWMAFLNNAVGGLQQAAILLQERIRNEEGLVPEKKSGVPRENSVSRALADLLCMLRAQQHIPGSGVQAVDLCSISSECERPRPHDPGISHESNPTDLSLVLLKDNELDFRIEAKSILDDSEIRKKFLREGGMLRFADNTNPYTLAAEVAAAVGASGRAQSRLAPRIVQCQCTKLHWT